MIVRYDYDNDVPMTLAPPLSQAALLPNTLLESPPMLLPAEQAISPFVTDVSSDGLIKLGFPEVMMTSPAMFADPAASGILRMSRRLSSIMADEEGDEYEVFEALNIQLSSSEFDDIQPISVGWSLKNFNGQEAEIQMDLE